MNNKECNRQPKKTIKNKIPNTTLFSFMRNSANAMECSYSVECFLLKARNSIPGRSIIELVK